MQTRTDFDPAATLQALRAQIVAHPYKAIAGAILLGAFAAYEQPRVPRNRVARAAVAMVGAVTIRAARAFAARQLFEAAKALWAPPQAVAAHAS